MQRRTSLWLWLSFPIAALAIVGSVVGIVFDHAIYSKETANWAAQSVGQDIANLVAFPALLVFAFAAAHGSLRAYLGWIGILVYSVYTYAIYTFDAHFGPLFLVWVGVFGLSIYALIGGLATLDPARVKSRNTGLAPIRFTSVLLVGTGSVFYFLWLSEIVPPMVSGTTPEALREVGLPTNPVHVLDLAVFLPSVLAAGVLLGEAARVGIRARTHRARGHGLPRPGDRVVNDCDGGARSRCCPRGRGGDRGTSVTGVRGRDSVPPRHRSGRPPPRGGATSARRTQGRATDRCRPFAVRRAGGPQASRGN